MSGDMDGYGYQGPSNKDKTIAELRAEIERLKDICGHQRQTLYFLEGSEDGVELHATDASRETIAELRAEVERLERLHLAEAQATGIVRGALIKAQAELAEAVAVVRAFYEGGYNASVIDRAATFLATHGGGR